MAKASSLVQLSPKASWIVTTKSGVQFDAELQIWRYRDGVSNVRFNFSIVYDRAPALVGPFKKALVWYAENHSPDHLSNLFNRFSHLLRTMAVGGGLREIDASLLLSYKASLSQSTIWYFGTLSGFFRKWKALGFGGISGDAIHLLKQIRVQGNQKGEAKRAAKKARQAGLEGKAGARRATAKSKV